MGTDPKAIARMKKMLELQTMMLRKQQARDGLGLNPMRLLKEDIERRRTPKERERGWINDYKGVTQPKKSFGYMDEQLVLSRKILGREPDNPQPFNSSLNNYKGRFDVKMNGQERGWTSNTVYKEPVANESSPDVLGMINRPILCSQPGTQHSQQEHNAGFKALYNNIKLENARKLETGWVSFGREQSKGRMGSGGMLGRSRGLTPSESQSLHKMGRPESNQERDLSSTDSTVERSSAVSREQKGQQQRKYHTRLLVPIGTLDRSGFGTDNQRASITLEGQRDTYNQFLETPWVNQYNAAASQRQWPSFDPQSGKERSDADILKEGIKKEEEEGWMSSYRRKQKREMCRLAKQRDMTASEVLKESYDRYREEGWINPLQRQKSGAYGLGSRHKPASEMMGSA